MRRQALGKWGEEQAAAYLRRQGLLVVERNYRCPLGEIDIIARDGDCLVFCEVKTRSSCRYGLPQEAVTWSKQQKIIKVASWYLGDREPAPDIRFDVIAITRSAAGRVEIEWLPAVFSLD